MSDIPENTTEIIEEGEQKEAFDLKKEVFEWIYTIVVALLIAFVIKGFIFDIVKVDGPSMETTLQNNDRLIITKLFYKPEQQDIIILDSTYKKRENYYESLEQSGKDMNAIEKVFDYFSLPDNLKKRYYVKRIIALPGQTVDIVEGKVLVDGEELEESYYNGSTPITDSSVEYPVLVEEGHVFVMGDNRPHSKDSRSSDLGLVPIDAILGKAQFRLFPFTSFGFVE
ncbi:MAG: signal peptidase I [Clostridia bacterium]|nr:signal peptidase I [Clostridia bacterium]